MGYHKTEITRGTPGTLSKIKEEIEEAIDASEQGVSIMHLHELSDIYLALEQHLRARFPNFGIYDLKEMAEVTQRAFESGSRPGGLSPRALTVHENQWQQAQWDREWLRYINERSLWKTYHTGYAVCLLSETQKVHVWLDCLKGSNLGGVHSHRWDLMSTILEGSLTHSVWEIQGEGSEEQITCGCNGPVEVCKTGKLERIDQRVIRRNSIYFSASGILHSIDDFEDGTITLVKKPNRDEKVESTFVPSSMPEENPYDNMVPLQDYEWEKVRKSLRRAIPWK